MAKKEDGQVLLEDARLIFRNFAGRPDRFNKEPGRNFGVIIPDNAVAEQMENDGWNVKWLDPREEGDERAPWLRVRVNYDGFRPPTVVLVTERGRTNLAEDQIETLDWAEIVTVDLIINPHPYKMEATGRSGISAYLKTMFVTIEEDELEKKYAELDSQ